MGITSQMHENHKFAKQILKSSLATIFYGIIIAQSAIQGVKAPCAAKAAIIPVTHGLKSKCPYGRFLFFAHGIMYANTMSQAAAKQTFGECARTMMKHSEIMVKNCGHNEKGELSYVYNSRVGKSGYAV